MRRVFFALALLYVVPFWTVHYLPTVDGPCHTYNAWVLRQYENTREYPLFQQYYEVNKKPYPNWISHGIMALLMFAVPPLVAEKLFVSLYALLFLSGITSAPPPVIREIETQPELIRVHRWKSRADYIYTWQMPTNAPFAARLQRLYDPVSVKEEGILWERRPPS